MKRLCACLISMALSRSNKLKNKIYDFSFIFISIIIFFGNILNV